MINKERHFETFLKQKMGWKEDLPFDTPVKVYPKGHCFISPGEVENHFHFLISGIVESVVVAKDGDEKITDLFFPNVFFCSLYSWITRKPSKVYLRCITDCTVESFSYEDYLNAMEKFPNLNILSKKIAEQAYIFRLNRLQDLLTKTAGERYIELVEKRPNIIKEIPISKIAHYLGIHPRSLSRIRRTVYK